MTEDYGDQIAALSAKVVRLEAERAILAALYRYGHAIDYGEEATWVDCFTEDAVYDLHFRAGGEEMGRARGYGVPHAKGTKVAGREALKAFVARHTRAPSTWHKHFLVEPMIAIAEDSATATVRSYFTRLDEVNGERIIHAFGRYLDEMVLCPDGVWRFRERIVEIESVRVAR